MVKQKHSTILHKFSQLYIANDGVFGFIIFLILIVCYSFKNFLLSEILLYFDSAFHLFHILSYIDTTHGSKSKLEWPFSKSDLQK